MKNSRYEFLVIGAAFIFALNGVIVKLVGATPVTAMFIRFFIPLLFSLFLVPNPIKIFKSSLFSKIALFLGLLSVVRAYLFFYGYIHAPLKSAIVLFFVWPIFAIFVNHFALKIKLKLNNLLLTFICLCGIILIFFDSFILLFSKASILGLFAMLGAAFLYALMMPIYKKYVDENSILETIVFQNLWCFILSLPLILFQTTNNFQLISLSIYNIFGGWLTFILYFKALRILKPTIFNIFTYFEVFFVASIGIIYFDEKLTPNFFIGALLVIVSSYLARKVD